MTKTVLLEWARCGVLVALPWALWTSLPCAAQSREPAASDASRPVRAHLRWQRPHGAAGCIAASALEDSVEAILGRTVFVPPSDADVLVTGRVVPPADGAGWSAVLQMSTTSGQALGVRELHTDAPGCDGLNQHVAVVMGLFVDFETREIALRLPPRSPDGALPEPWHGSIQVGPSGALGLLPSVTMGATVALELRPPGAWPIRLEARWLLPRVKRVATVETTVTLYQVGLGVCPRFQVGDASRLFSCALVSGGQLGAQSDDLVVTEGAKRSLWAGEMRVGVASEIGDLDLSASLGVVVPMVRDSFVFLDSDGSEVRVHRASPVAVVADLTLGFDFF